MALANTETQYGAVAKALHWSVALGILAMIPLGLVAVELPHDTADQLARKALLFSVHKTVGVTLFFLALVRIGWAIVQPRPAPVHPDRKAETLAAEVVHWLLYGSLVLLPLSGWVHHAATSGFAPIWWPLGQTLPLVPESTAVAGIAAALHVLFLQVLGASLVLHIVGALKHHWWDRDATLRRMLPAGGASAGVQGAHRGALAGLAGAMIVWGGAIGAGAAVGVFDEKARTTQVAALGPVESDWQVQSGTLGIAVRQMGSTVEGSFEDWTAAIAFEPSEGTGPKGDVTVEVSIGSLTLGSVTNQAMGPDYFNVDQFPTATFEAEILRTEEGYVAEGTLRLRGAEVPVSLPFTLDIDGDTAEMQGSLTLDRRSFGIGDGMTDESQLGFGVDVTVDLTATRVGEAEAPNA